MGGSVRRTRRTTPSAGAVVGASVFMVEETIYGGKGGGCRYVMRDAEMVETDVEGVEQWRHVDMAHSGILHVFFHFFLTSG